MTRVKICGVTTPADAVFAADCGADALGLNFVPASPRYLTADRAAAVVAGLTPFVATVGVFAGGAGDDVRAMATRLGLRAVQTYDAGPPAAAYAPAAHVAAFRIATAADLLAVTEYVRVHRPAAVLLDSFVTGALGGTGHRAPWELLAGFDPGVPVILAGGLTPDNVAEAIRLVRPWGVDVASGVEASPGVKDRAKVRDFVRAAKGAAGF